MSDLTCEYCGGELDENGLCPICDEDFEDDDWEDDDDEWDDDDDDEDDYVAVD